MTEELTFMVKLDQLMASVDPMMKMVALKNALAKMFMVALRDMDFKTQKITEISNTNLYCASVSFLTTVPPDELAVTLKDAENACVVIRTCLDDSKHHRKNYEQFIAWVNDNETFERLVTAASAKTGRSCTFGALCSRIDRFDTFLVEMLCKFERRRTELLQHMQNGAKNLNQSLKY